MNRLQTETQTLQSKPAHALTISELNREAKRLLEVSFREVWVFGEISSLSRPRSGHWYFTLKDEQAQVRCAMFKGFNVRMRFQPKEGDQVLARAKVSLYEGRGDYQLIVEHLEPYGAGTLQKAFEQLKEKLNLEGLFATTHKQSLPIAPQRIGVITSPTGAAIHDILSVLERRSPMTEVIIIPVTVQGETAAPDIVKAIKIANEMEIADVLIVGRGGGSLEDLWAFNEEIVARAIYASKIPIVSAVGHEVDFTIADFVADHRAATPSAAAELLSTDQVERFQRLDDLANRLNNALNQALFNKAANVQQLFKRLQPPQQQIRAKSDILQQLKQRLSTSMKQQLQNKQSTLKQLENSHQQCNPMRRLQQHRDMLDNLQNRLKNIMEIQLKQAAQRLQVQGHALHTVSPLATLDRGYAIARKSNTQVIRSVTEIKCGEQIQLRVSDGTIDCDITQIKEEDGGQH